jgi:hypothetical protein
MGRPGRRPILAGVARVTVPRVTGLAIGRSFLAAFGAARFLATRFKCLGGWLMGTPLFRGGCKKAFLLRRIALLAGLSAFVVTLFPAVLFSRFNEGGIGETLGGFVGSQHFLSRPGLGHGFGFERIVRNTGGGSGGGLAAGADGCTAASTAASAPARWTRGTAGIGIRCRSWSWMRHFVTCGWSLPRRAREMQTKPFAHLGRPWERALWMVRIRIEHSLRFGGAWRSVDAWERRHVLLSNNQ